jgi:MSHA pilin protein MshD
MTFITRHTRTSPRRAFTLVEAAVSCIIVAVMLSAALATSGAARAREQKAIDRQRGLFLAQSLMSEILDKAYVDPGALPLFGPEAAEVSHSRSTYNDVDDFDGLTDSPPKDSSGAAIVGYSRWSRTVTVQWVTPGNLNTVSLTETNLKKVTVTVKKNSVPVVELNALRSKARDSL